MREKQIILVVEDEAINRRIIGKILGDSYRVIEAENGKLGLDLCEKHANEIAAILLDLSMPVMDGYAFMEAIKATPYHNIPIIVMTGSTDVVTEQKALKAGAWDFVSKPYNAAVLHIRLQNAIARSKEALFDQIKYVSEHDSLTGLYNRNKMFAKTQTMIAENPAQEYLFMRLDIDHFGLYNSSFGEEAGDKLLCVFAGMIERCAKTFGQGVYGRINADVFAVCIPMPFEGNKTALMDNLRIAQKMLNAHSADYVLKMSVGVYVISIEEIEKTDEMKNLNVAEFYLRASFAASECKHRFDSIAEYYDEKFKQKIDEEIAITNDMQKALDHEEFVVYFQPKYQVHTNMPCGAEALVRWQHPVKGLISPGLFIPVFEGNGFIAKVDYYVWEHTCKRIRKWMDEGKEPQPVSVNISRVSLYNGNLDKILTELVRKYGIEPRLLELEITESAYMTSPEQMHELVARLHDAGFTILMDDFGSDYSSLNALKDIEVDILKIDMAFVPKGDDVEKAEIILASIIQLGRQLGMGVIVEGVETQRQRDFLDKAGCDVIQGYFYSKPLPPEEYEKKYVENC